MLNPRHMHSLNRSMQLILGPHSTLLSPTSQIQQGEHLLNQLRSLPQYRILLCYYLTQTIQQHMHMLNQGHYQVQNSNTNTNPNTNNNYNTNANAHVNNACVFVLLELEKMFPLEDEACWWHLLQFYYVCNQKSSKLVLQIIGRHFATGIMQNAYQGFLTQTPWTPQLPLGTTIKLLNILHTILHKIHLHPTNSQLPHIHYIHSYISKVIKDNNSLPIQIAQKILTLYLHLYLLMHRIYAHNQDNQEWRAEWEHEVREAVREVEDAMGNWGCLGGVMGGVRVVVWVMSGRKIGECRVGDVLRNMLWARGKAKEDIIRQFYMLTYFITQLKNNDTILGDHCNQIIAVYHKYITEVEIRKPAQQFLADPFNQEQQTQEHAPSFQCSQSFRYNLLTHLMAKQLPQLQPQLRLVSCLSHCNYHTLVSLHLLQTPLHTLNQRILAFTRSLPHHPSTNTRPLTLPSLKHLLTLLHSSPASTMLQIYQNILNIRCSYRQYAEYVDVIYNKSIGFVVSCVEVEKVWEFVCRLVKCYVGDFMEVKAGDFWVVFVGLEAMPKWVYVGQDMPFLELFAIVMQLIIEEELNHESHKHNSSSPSQFDLFYKLTSSISAYLSSKPTISPSTSLSSTLQKCKSFTFRYQLYCKQTAYLYIKHLQYQHQDKNNIGAIKQMVNNMMGSHFWQGLDTADYAYYLCVLWGIIKTWPQQFGAAYYEFWQALGNMAEGIFGKDGMKWICEYVHQFIELMETAVNKKQQNIMSVL